MCVISLIINRMLNLDALTLVAELLCIEDRMNFEQTCRAFRDASKAASWKHMRVTSTRGQKFLSLRAPWITVRSMVLAATSPVTASLIHTLGANLISLQISGPLTHVMASIQLVGRLQRLRSLNMKVIVDLQTAGYMFHALCFAVSLAAPRLVELTVDVSMVAAEPTRDELDSEVSDAFAGSISFPALETLYVVFPCDTPCIADLFSWRVPKVKHCVARNTIFDATALEDVLTQMPDLVYLDTGTEDIRSFADALSDIPSLRIQHMFMRLSAYAGCTVHAVSTALSHMAWKPKRLAIGPYLFLFTEKKVS